ncbi:pentatricopeptide repeat-containing protein 1, mitochondrial [Trichonephila clavipes]|nr:pentatricopeptide repeat-containing protein 1, mitochondrial [Trichonephila clavipes]
MIVLRRNCRNISYFLRSLEIQKNNLHQKCCFKLVNNYSTVASIDEKEISSTSKSDSENVDSRDIFGSLRKPLEKTKIRHNAKFCSDTNVKVVRVKNRPKLDLSNDPDVFGNLSNKNPIWYSDISEDSAVDNNLSDDSTIIRNISKQYKDPKEYLQKMKYLVSEKKIKEALELFIDMRKNFVKPLHAHYTFMIGACGRFGFTEMAFKLLRQDEVEKLAYQLNEEAERTETPIRRLSKGMYGSTCADMQVDVMGECLSSIKHVVNVTSVFLAKRLHAV